MKAHAIALAAILATPLGAVTPAATEGASRKAADRARPNVIFLMDDQHRWDALGWVNPAVRTPHLDALAKSGVFFDQAVCQAPMCTPSRNSMMLGLYPNQAGVLRNGRTGLADDQLPTPPLPEMFRKAGYQTAGFGKTHWGIVCSTRGFEIRYAAECPEEGAVMMKDDAREAKTRYDAESETMGGGEENNDGYLGFTSRLPEHEHRDGWVTGKCLDFIEHGIDPKRPLFLYLSFLKPHAGHNVPAGYEDLYDPGTVKYARQPPWQEDRSPHALGVNDRGYTDYWSKASAEQWRLMTLRYRANCTWIDDMFGRTLQKLKEQGLLDNAIIVYCSDHGEMLGERRYRFNKYCLYESSVRVPLILSGTAIPKELRGVTDHRPAELVDLYPSLLRAAGIEVPERVVGLDLLGGQQRPASFSTLHERQGEAAFMWRTATHKLILVMKRRAELDAGNYTAGDIIGGEFYDLAKDPQEWNNLYADPAAAQATLKMMTGQLLEFLKTQGRMTKPKQETSQ
ncbi:MAG: sulfatase-like hydrolase/transferase [Akkermansiaceae bacterium]|nr:sulfatase-like hydrolase/transferase [Akkermansiaceae bacterium]MCF7730673.1 sulfatase-like hydrolase/transferase [Akkermansiaceae bacterium]